MPTQNDDGITRPADWKISSKNPSSRREISTTDGERSSTHASGKNPGGSKETPATGRVTRSRPGDHLTPYGLRNGNNSSERRADLGKGQKPEIAKGRNSGTANKEEPKARINSGKTKVKTYPAGRNRGRNYKG